MNNKLKKIFKNTTVRVISLLLLVLFIASVYFYPNFYKRQAHKVLGYYHVYKGDLYYKQNKPQMAINSYLKGDLNEVQLIS